MTVEPASRDPLRDGDRPPTEASSSRLDASRPLHDREGDGRPPATSVRSGPPAGKSHIGWYWWLVWSVLLAIGMFVFYVLFTPVWIGIRLAAWVSERSPRRRS